jgi:hypothetical protein
MGSHPRIQAEGELATLNDLSTGLPRYCASWSASHMFVAEQVPASAIKDCMYHMQGTSPSFFFLVHFLLQSLFCCPECSRQPQST